MDYATFKQHVIDFSWRENDSKLDTSFNSILQMAENEIITRMQLEDLHASAQVQVTDTSGLDIALPADYHSIRSVYGNSLNRGEFLYIPPAELRWRREQSSSRYWDPVYSLRGSTIMFNGPTPTPGEPSVFDIDYITKLPDYQGTNASWFADQYLNIYTYATLKHIAVWAREDERIPFYDSLVSKDIDLANADSAMHRRIGKFSDMPLPTTAGVPRHSTTRRGSYKVRGFN